MWFSAKLNRKSEAIKFKIKLFKEANMAVTKITTTNTTFMDKVSQIFIGTYFATLDRVKKRREYLKTIRELEKMSNRDLADIGLSRAEIKARALKSIYKINI